MTFTILETYDVVQTYSSPYLKYIYDLLCFSPFNSVMDRILKIKLIHFLFYSYRVKFTTSIRWFSSIVFIRFGKVMPLFYLENILKFTLTLTLLNFLNGIIYLSFLEQSIFIFKGIKMRTWSWTANSIEPDQTTQMCRLAWLYTGGRF